MKHLPCFLLLLPVSSFTNTEQRYIQHTFRVCFGRTKPRSHNTPRFLLDPTCHGRKIRCFNASRVGNFNTTVQGLADHTAAGLLYRWSLTTPSTRRSLLKPLEAKQHSPYIRSSRISTLNRVFFYPDPYPSGGAPAARTTTLRPFPLGDASLPQTKETPWPPPRACGTCSTAWALTTGRSSLCPARTPSAGMCDALLC